MSFAGLGITQAALIAMRIVAFLRCHEAHQQRRRHGGCLCSAIGYLRLPSMIGTPPMVLKSNTILGMREHWDKVYGTKAPNQVSWFRPHLETSLELIERATRGDRSSSIIDLGGGASTLVDDLIERGYQKVTVLDISQTALDVAQKRLGDTARSVQWLHADVEQANVPARSFDVWHDRAVFHFLKTPEERLAYVRKVTLAVRQDGHIIVSTFGPDGPTRCSGLDVVRYDAESLHGEFGAPFRLVESSKELHETPSGTTQQFLYCHFTLEQ